jgi:proline iminopeptidase
MPFGVRSVSGWSLDALSSTATASATRLNTFFSDEEITMPDKYLTTALYPPIEPYKRNTIQVSELHRVAYSLYGNQHGKPVLFVHGGPGGATDPSMARFFDPNMYFIILVDQRGCGDSTPFAELTDNTTQDSIRDFEKIRVKLGIQKWQIFGGSWGSTLALAYAVSIAPLYTKEVQI